MKKTFLAILFCLALTASASAFGGHRGDGNQPGGGDQPGGGGTPEPASIILIIGGAAALGIKGLLNRKK